MKIIFGKNLNETKVIKEQIDSTALGLLSAFSDSGETEKPGESVNYSGSAEIQGAETIVQRAKSVEGKWVYKLGGKPSPNVPPGSEGVEGDCTGYVFWCWGIQQRDSVRDSGVRVLAPQAGCAVWYNPRTDQGAKYGHSGVITNVYPDGDFDVYHLNSSKKTVTFAPKSRSWWTMIAGGMYPPDKKVDSTTMGLMFLAPPGSKIIDNPDLSKKTEEKPEDKKPVAESIRIKISSHKKQLNEQFSSLGIVSSIGQGSKETTKGTKDTDSKSISNVEPSEALKKIKTKLDSNKQRMADIIYEEFVSAGLHPNIAIAAIVNADTESGLNPEAVGDGGHSIGLFQLHDRGGGQGMSVEDRKDPRKNSKRMIETIKGSFGKDLRSSAEQNVSIPDLAAIFSRDVERPADKEGNMKSRKAKAEKWLSENKKLIIKFGGLLEEGKKSKDDRCVRIAKRKYKAWPSAYASGAVVKCRQGKIWKKIKEEKTERINKTDPGHSFHGQSHFYSNDQEEEMEEGRKLGKPSSETNLGDWFKRKGAPGKKGGWVDCNTCRDGKCKPCGRQEGEKRSKYPRCRPTPSQCKGYKRRGSNLQKEE